MNSVGSENPDVLFVSESPGAYEDKARGGYKSDGAKLIMELAADVGLNARFTYLIRCHAGRGPDGKAAKIPKDALAECPAYLDEEIEKYKPKVIVPMGSEALKALTGRNGILAARGNVILKKDRVFIPTFNVGFIMKSPEVMPTFAGDFEMIKAYIDGTYTVVDRKYHLVDTLEKVKQAIRDIRRKYRKSQHKLLVFDIETGGDEGKAGLRPWDPKSRILSIGMSVGPDEAWCFPLFKSDGPWTKLVNGVKKFMRKTVWKIMRWLSQFILSDPEIQKMNHNIKFDQLFWEAHTGLPIRNITEDTMLMHYAINEEKGIHSLKQLAIRYSSLGNYSVAAHGAAEDAENASKQKNFDKIPLLELYQYNCADADATGQVHTNLVPLLEAQGTGNVYKQLLMQASHVLAQIEGHGLTVDTKKLAVVKKHFESEIHRLHDELMAYPEIDELRDVLRQKAIDKYKDECIKKGTKNPKYKTDQQIWEAYKNRTSNKDKDIVNFNSTDQLRILLYKFMGVELIEEILTESGEKSTSKKALAPIRKIYPFVHSLLSYRAVEKLYGTYVEKCEGIMQSNSRWATPEGKTRAQELRLLGQWHGGLLIHGTVTGRLSSRSPNMQNIPSRGEEGKMVKSLFVSRFEGGSILQADYSQAELRVLASVANEKGMIKAFWNPKIDFHKATAAELFEMPLEDVGDDERHVAKTLNFGIVYGKGPESLARELGWYIKDPKTKKMVPDKAKAARYLDDYKARKPGLTKWNDKTVEFAKKNGFVWYPTGRKRRLPDMNSSDREIASQARRQAINSPIQGTASDMTLMSNIIIYHYMQKKGYKSLLCATVHDSIILEIYPGEEMKVARLVKKIMENLPKYAPKFFPYMQWDWLKVPMRADISAGKSWGEVKDLDMEAA